MKVGFVGGGALAESFIRGLKIDSQNIFVSECRQSRCDELVQKYHIHAAVSVDDFINNIDILVIAVKPKDVKAAMSAVCDKVNESTIVISVVAGFPISEIENFFKTQKVIRIMPNVAVSVGEGMIALSAGSKTNINDVKIAKEFLSAVGRCVEVDEKLMDAVTGLSGSGPAYAFLMIDAMADGGVAMGLPRADAIELAAQTLLGAAKMVVETGEHPDVLRDRVTSPAGTTIEGVRILERCGLRSALIEAVIAATNKSKSL